MVDIFLILMLPGAGDELQGIKKGVLELADMIAVNKTDGEIAEIVKNMECFNLKPASIIKRLKLKQPMYSETAAYGHMGRSSEKKNVKFCIKGEEKDFEIETFTWEKIDCQEEIKTAFNL